MGKLAGFLERARSEAVATRSLRLVAFADAILPDKTGALRHYALFAIEEPDRTDRDLPQVPRRLTPWHSLPSGLLFAQADHFDTERSLAFRTLHDLPGTREVPVPLTDGDGTETLLALPCLVFGPDGGVREPPYHDADALHLGLIEAFRDSNTGKTIFTSTRGGRNGTHRFPNGECLEIGFYTGRSRILTD